MSALRGEPGIIIGGGEKSTGGGSIGPTYAEEAGEKAGDCPNREKHGRAAVAGPMELSVRMALLDDFLLDEEGLEGDQGRDADKEVAEDAFEGLRDANGGQ